MAKIPQYELTAETLDTAVQDFETHGCLQISNFLSPEQVHAFLDQFSRHYESCPEEHPFEKVGDRRHLMPIAVQGAFNAPSLYAAPMMLALFERLLGECFVLGSLMCVTALSGAEVQHRHRDFPGLFLNALDYFGPSYAIKLLVPLVPLNQLHGTTQVWPGTHRRPVAAEDAAEEDCVTPEVPVGSALLTDFRLLHQGSVNRSDRSRPVLSLGYYRSWFIDTANYPNVNPLIISRAEYEKMDESHQTLFSRAVAGFDQ